MTKEEKITRYRKLNQKVTPGQIICAGSSLMEMFPVEKFIEEDHLDITIYNRGIGGFITDELLENIDINDPLKDADGNLKAEYTIEGMHIREEGYRVIFDLFMGYAKEPRWK